MAQVNLDLMEYANDAAAQAAFASLALSKYPPAQNYTYVKATSDQGSLEGSWPFTCTDPTKSLTGPRAGNCWISNNYPAANRLHIDIGVEKVLTGIYYENLHDSGNYTNRGVKNFTLWGSNSPTAFAELTYGIDTGWTQLATSQSTFDQHVAADQADPKYITVIGATAYRYYAIKCADNYLGTYNTGFRRIELQVPPLYCFSEPSIKQEGSYALKGIASITDSLNKTLTRTVSPVINLTDKNIIKFDIRASRIGSNIKIGIHDLGGTVTEITPNILAADTWQLVVWDLSQVANVNKDAIDQIVITIINADADNIFYVDNMFADVITNYLIHRGRDRFRTLGYSLG